MMNTTINQENKSLIWDYWITLQNANAARLYEVVDSVMSKDVRCLGPAPIDELQGAEALVENYWSPRSPWLIYLRKWWARLGLNQ